jgi:hypothetical protein
MPAPRSGSAPERRPAPRRRWRDYRTTSDRSPVEEFIDSLPDADAAAVLAGMTEVRDRGLAAARHLAGEIWEVRAEGRGMLISEKRYLCRYENRRKQD